MRAPDNCLPLPEGERVGERANLLLLLPLLLAGCFNPDDIFPVKGSLSSAAPVEGQTVRLLRGSATLDAPLCHATTPFKETTAASDGTFSFDVFRAQAQKLTGLGQFCFRLETTFPSGTQVSSELQSINGPLNVPPFTDWTPGLSLEAGELHFAPAAEDAPDAGVQELTLHRAVFQTSDGGVIWIADDVLINLETGEPQRRPLVLDDLALEDFSGTLMIKARRNVIDEGDTIFSGAAYTLEWQAGQALTLTGQRTPMSRGLSCVPFADPCPLTDGDVARVDGVSGTTSVVLSLPMPAPLSSIVLRGVETEASLMGVLLTGEDGGMLSPVQHVLPVSAWSASQPDVVGPRDPGPVPTDGGEPGFTFKFQPAFSVVHLDAGVPVKTVRLVFPRGLEGMEEVSLFE